MQKRLKRVLLTSLSGQLGGMEMRIADEARFLAQQGSSCVLAPSRFADRDPWLAGLVRECDVFETFDLEPPPFFEEWRWRRLNFLRAKSVWPQRLKQLQVDLAHVFYAWTFDGGTRTWLCHRAGIPTVLSIHNSFPKSELSRFHKLRTAEAFSSVRGLYAVSESALTHFLSTYGSYVRNDAVVRVIPNFVDIRRFAPNLEYRQTLRASLGIPESGLVMGSIGRLDTQKEPVQVLDLFEQVCAERDDVFLVYCGQGPLESEIKRRVALSPWKERVKFLGFRSDVEKVFPLLDVHVLLSKQEGFGISTAEAMACGVPVLVTDVPGSRDVFNGSDAGASIRYDDSAAALEAISHLLASRAQRDAMGVAGRCHASTYFSKESWGEKLDDFYQNIDTQRPVWRR